VPRARRPGRRSGRPRPVHRRRHGARNGRSDRTNPPHYTLRTDRMKPFTTTRRVEFGDTDMAGIMHFSNFFRFMEAAESDFLRSLGLSVSWFEDGTKWGFPRVSAACDFKKPAKFQDVLSITV